MNMGLSASTGALHACDGDSAGARTQQLQLQRARPSLNGRSSGRFRRLATGLGFGALLSLGAASALAGELPPAPTAAPAPAAKASSPAETSAPASAEAKAAVATQLIATTTEDVKQAVAAESETPDRDPNEILQFGAMRVQRWIVETILKASEVTGSDPVYMMALADKESSFIPANKASTSSAEGLFQFISSTWLQMVRTYGPKHGLAAEAEAIERVKGKLQVRDEATRDRILRLRRDPYLSALMAGEMMKRDRAVIERKIGRPLDRSEYYLAHFLGVDSAGKLMALVDDNSTQSASSAFPAAAKANKSLFYAKDGRKTRNLSVAEVYNKLDGMMGERIDRYEGVAARVIADATE